MKMTSKLWLWLRKAAAVAANVVLWTAAAMCVAVVMCACLVVGFFAMLWGMATEK